MDWESAEIIYSLVMAIAAIAGIWLEYRRTANETETRMAILEHRIETLERTQWRQDDGEDDVTNE